MVGMREIWIEGGRYGLKERDMDWRREIWIEGGRYGLNEGDIRVCRTWKERIDVREKKKQMNILKQEEIFFVYVWWKKGQKDAIQLGLRVLFSLSY